MDDATMKFLEKSLSKYETIQAYLEAYNKIESLMEEREKIIAEFPRLRMIYTLGTDDEKKAMAWDLLISEIEKEVEDAE